MISEKSNKILTEVGPGTPLGKFMRAYWLPVAHASEVKAGAAPRRVKLLGENRVVFRTPEGKAGVMDEACPHRGASMMLAVNESCGLRCIYHGWKFSPEGQVLDAPSFPEGTPLDEIPTRVYPVEERQGIIWAWFGDRHREEVPPFWQLAFSDLPDDHVTFATAILNCGWLQPLETLWDVFHAQILHNHTNHQSPRAKDYFSGKGRRAGNLIFDYPETVVERRPYGMSHTNIDAIKETRAEFVLPCVQFHAISPEPRSDKGVQFSVPVDDDHVMLWMIFFNLHAPLQENGFARFMLGQIPDRTNFMRGLEERTPENLWGQDRKAVDEGRSFAGITHMGGATILAEDTLVLESQGRPDRTREWLAPPDAALAAGRRAVLDGVERFARGEAPPAREMDLRQVTSEYVSKRKLMEAG